MSRPDWSVMIPVHAPDLRLLDETLRSVADSGLDLRAHQVACMVGGPRSPELERLLAGWEDRGVALLRNDGDSGMVGNWNACIDAAAGRWIHILHQDDAVNPGFYDALAAGFRAEPRAGAAFVRTEFVDGENQRIGLGHLEKPEAGVLHDWIQHAVANLAIQCPSIAVRREVYEQVGRFDASYAYCPDADLWARIATAYPLWFDPRPLARYRMHAASATYTRFTMPRRWIERRRCLDAAVRRLSPPVQATARAVGRFYQTKLAIAEWDAARGAATRWSERARLWWWRHRTGSRAERKAVEARRYPAPVPGRAPERGEDPSAPRRPRVLLVSEFFPHPPERAVFGVYQRLFRTVQAADRFGHFDAVFFWSDNHPVPLDAVAAHQQALRAAGWPLSGALDIIPTAAGAQGEWHRYPARAVYWMVRGAMSFMQHRPSLRCGGSDQADALRGLLQQRQPDLIIAHRAGVVGTLLRTRLALPPVVLELDDIDHVKISRLHQTEGATVPRWQVAWWTGLAWWSARRAARLAAACVVCSERDAAALRGPAPRARIEVVPNTSFERAALPPASAPVALFVGVAYYPPNADAIRWLIREIWPQVRARCPAAELVVVGEGAEAAVDGAAGPGVALVGFAPDLEPHYRRAAVCLCPIRAGSGTRIKIIEAAFCARPVVSTTLGAEGLNFRPGAEILIADAADAFADAVARLLTDPERGAALGQAARRRAESDYAPEVLVAQLTGIYGSLCDHAKEARR